MIIIDNLSYHVNSGAESLHILSNINGQINKGDTVAITGSSGSGKTTLLALLAGLDVPTGGAVDIEGHNISAMTEDQRALFRAEKVGFVFQAFHLLPSLTALDNVMLPLSLAKTANAQQQAIDLLQQVGLGHRLHHKPSQLSGGEQQRVAIARAFASKPAYLFADEPTGNLDQKTGKMITDLLFQLNEQHQTTLILVTHEQALAERCDRQLQLSDKGLFELKGDKR